MKETLREIVHRMEHNLNRWDESVSPARRVCFSRCPKCCLEALLPKYEQGDLIEVEVKAPADSE